MTIRDLIIIGAGPGGVTSAIYAKRAGLDVLVFEKYAIGGQVVNAFEIENYPGFSKINGFDLALLFQNQLKDNDIKVINEEVIKIEPNDNYFKIITNNNEYFSKKVILALGSKHKTLSLSNLEKYEGHGISYCATCDGAFYKDKNVAIAGAGNSAISEAIYLAKIAKSVNIIVRSKVKAEQSLVKELLSFKNVNIFEGYEITKLDGDINLSNITITNKVTKDKKILEIEGVFVYIGLIPSTKFLLDLGITDENGYIITDNHFETKIKGLYAIGDCIKKDLRQIVNSTSDGAMVIHYIKD